MPVEVRIAFPAAPETHKAPTLPPSAVLPIVVWANAHALWKLDWAKGLLLFGAFQLEYLHPLAGVSPVTPIPIPKEDVLVASHEL